MFGFCGLFYSLAGLQKIDGVAKKNKQTFDYASGFDLYWLLFTPLLLCGLIAEA